MTFSTGHESNGKAVAYLRLSYVKGEGGELGEMTLEDQMTSCIGVAASRGLEITKVYDEGQGRSAFKAGNRPEWDRMLTELEPGTAVIGWATSRISRNSEETWRDIDDRGGILLTADGGSSETLMGKQAMAFANVVDEFYSRRKSEEIIAGHARSRKNGRVLGKPSYGYNKKDAVLSLIPEEAAVIREVAQNYLDGSNWEAEAKRLREEGILNRGKPFQGNSIRQLFVSCRVAGFQDDKEGNLIQVTDEPALEPRIWHQVTAEIARRKGKRNAGNTGTKSSNNLLANLIRCNQCGSFLAKRQAVSTDGRNYSYTCRAGKSKGLCKQYPGVDNLKNSARGRTDIVDEYVVRETIGRMAKLELAESQGNKKAGTQLATVRKAWAAELDPTVSLRGVEIENRLAVLDEKLDRAISKLATADDDMMEVWEGTAKEIKVEQRNLKEELGNLEPEQVSTPYPWSEWQDVMMSDEEDFDVLSAFINQEGLDTAQKVLRVIIEDMVLHKMSHEGLAPNSTERRVQPDKQLEINWAF